MQDKFLMFLISFSRPSAKRGILAIFPNASESYFEGNLYTIGTLKYRVKEKRTMIYVMIFFVPSRIKFH